jgi:hypothetical protein
VGKRALRAVPTIEVREKNGGHASDPRIRAARWLRPPYDNGYVNHEIHHRQSLRGLFPLRSACEEAIYHGALSAEVFSMSCRRFERKPGFQAEVGADLTRVRSKN